MAYEHRAENAYVNQLQTENEDYGIIDEILSYVISVAEDGETKKSRSEDLLETKKKIDLNFKGDAERLEVQQYFTLAYTKLPYIEEKFSQISPEDQDDVHAYLLDKYKELASGEKPNIEILRQLFKEVIPTSKRNNPRYLNAAHAFILLFFDDCTLFEKTEKQKQVKEKNLFTDL